MQMPPFSAPTHKYDQAEVEDKERELTRDFTGSRYPEGYWVGWLILIVLVVVGLVLLDVFHVF